MDTCPLYADDTTCQSEALEREAEALTDEAILYWCPTHEVWQHRGESIMEKAERIVKDLKQIREAIAFVISEAVSNGWTTEREDRYIDLAKREDELVLSLAA